MDDFYKLDLKLASIYQHTQHSLKHSNLKILFNEQHRLFNHEDSIIKMVTNKNYSYIIHKIKPNKNSSETTIPIINDFVLGLYFPNNKNGDIINISSWGITFSSIIITDNTKIYSILPDNYGISIGSSPGFIRTDCQEDYYILGIYLYDMKYKIILNNGGYHFQLNDGEQIVIKNGLIRNKNKNNRKHIKIGYRLQYPRHAAAMTIQRFWIKYNHKKKMKMIKEELENIPEFGINYFRVKKNFEKKCKEILL